MQILFHWIKNFKLENPKSITLSHLNVSSFRNKFVPIGDLIKTKLDIFVAYKAKIYQRFPTQQFSIDGCKVYHKDQNCFNGGLLFYVNENIPGRELTAAQIDFSLEIILLEITLRTWKWLLIGFYKPPNQKEEYFLRDLSVVLNNYLSTYEHILLGDFILSNTSKHLAILWHCLI